MCVVAAGLDRLKVCSIRAGGVVVCCGGFDRKWDGGRGSTELVLYMSRCGRMLAVYMWVMSPLLPLFVSRLTTLMTGRDRFVSKESAQSKESKPGAHTPTQPAPTAGSKVTEDRHYSAAVITTPSRLPCLCLPGPGVAFADDVPLMPPPTRIKTATVGNRVVDRRKKLCRPWQAPRFKHDLRRRR